MKKSRTRYITILDDISRLVEVSDNIFMSKYCLLTKYNDVW